MASVPQLQDQAAVRTRVRYKVLAFCCALAAVTYLDRVCIAVTANDIMRDLALTPVQMSFVFSAFTFAYGLFEIPTGHWGDRIGSRRVLTRIVSWWSAFTIATAGTFNYVSLLTVRFLFGAGEAGAWPNAARTFSRWFPSSERGTAQGIFFMGAHLAGGVTPILVARMLTVMHWRWVFVIFGMVGFVWAFFWYRWVRDEPSEHPSVNASELKWIEEGRLVQAKHSGRMSDFIQLLGQRNMLALCGMYFTQTYGFYFYITWLPTYLENVRGMKSMKLGLLAGLPLLLSVLADLLGGLSTDYAVKRFGLRWGRSSVGLIAFAAAAVFMAAGAAAEDVTTSAVLIALAAACSNFPLGAAWGAAVDIGGNRSGMVTACMNTAGQVGGMLSPVVLALVVREFSSWAMPLYATAILYGFGALCWLVIDASKPLRVQRS
jgi:MFS transporter, ACS family, glucarate transporter